MAYWLRVYILKADIQIQILAWLFNSCVTMNKSPNLCFSGSHQWMMITVSTSWSWCEDYKMIYVNGLEQCLAYVKHQVSVDYFYCLLWPINLIVDPSTLAATFLSIGFNLVKLPFMRAFIEEIFFLFSI